MQVLVLASSLEISELGHERPKKWINWSLPNLVACKLPAKSIAMVVCHPAHHCLGKGDGSDKNPVGATSLKHSAEKGVKFAALLHSLGSTFDGCRLPQAAILAMRQVRVVRSFAGVR